MDLTIYRLRNLHQILWSQYVGITNWHTRGMPCTVVSSMVGSKRRKPNHQPLTDQHQCFNTHIHSARRTTINLCHTCYYLRLKITGLRWIPKTYFNIHFQQGYIRQDFETKEITFEQNIEESMKKEKYVSNQSYFQLMCNLNHSII